ncbi:hypothetical protein GY50_1024 [Dehalococcoides mccartyi GY50]|nr:hypothetical protein GY50_1024 [Dehalococcoides mccartyi GY50]
MFTLRRAYFCYLSGSDVTIGFQLWLLIIYKTRGDLNCRTFNWLL